MKKIDEDKDPCWKGYEMIGMKKKGTRKVPNCVPVKEEEQIDEISTKLARSYLSKATDVGSNKRRTQGVFRARGKMTGEPYEKVDKSGITVGHVYPKVLTKEEQIDELKKSTLGSYLKKAHVSGLAAADDAASAYHRKDYKELHKQNKTGEKRESGVNLAADKLSGRARVAANEGTLPQEGPFAKAMTNDGHPNVYHQTDAVSYKDSAERMKAGKVYDPHRTELNKDIKEEKGDRVIPGSLSPELQKQVQDLSKDIASGGGASIALKGNPTKTINISGDAPERGNKIGTRAPLNEKAPPGAKFERMVKHIKKSYSKDGLTAKEKSIAYATAWKAKNREKGE